MKYTFISFTMQKDAYFAERRSFVNSFNLYLNLK